MPSRVRSKTEIRKSVARSEDHGLGFVILKSAIPVGKNKIYLIERWYCQTLIATMVFKLDCCFSWFTASENDNGHSYTRSSGS